MSFVYKVCSIEEWNKASEKGIYEGSQVDLEDGFIHLSTKKQLKETVTKHFFGQERLLLISFSIKNLQDKLKWEISRNGKNFPHYYGNIETKFLNEKFNLDLRQDGFHEFPKNFFS